MKSLRARVKICGLTRSEDALLAQRLGSSALGFIFYSKSPRAVHALQVRDILEKLPDSTEFQRVGVFVDASLSEIVDTVQTASIDTVQLHGEESPEFCTQLKRHIPRIHIIKAFRLRDEKDLTKIPRYAHCDSILLDTYLEGVMGGSGVLNDFDLVGKIYQTQHLLPPLILSGGLRPTNVNVALSRVHARFIDVSSGIESAPGIKDPLRMKALFEALQEELS